MQVNIALRQRVCLANGPESVPVDIGASLTTIGDLAWFTDAPHGISVYLGESFESLGGVTLPVRIDWQVLGGLGPDCTRGVWETVPLAAGSTFLAGPFVGNQLNREGMLFQIHGFDADWWLVRGRIFAAQAPYRTLRIYLRAASGCGDGCCATAVTAGSVIG